MKSKFFSILPGMQNKMNHCLRVLVLFFSVGCFAVNAQSITGPTVVNVGETKTYYYSDDMTISNPIWNASKGGVLTSSKSGITYQVQIIWNTVGAGSVTFKNGTTTLSTLAVTINGVPDPPDTNDGASCGPGTVMLTAVLPVGSTASSIRWFSSAKGGSHIFEGNSFITPSLSTTTTYYATAFDATTGGYSSRVATVAYINSFPDVAVSASAVSVCSEFPFESVSFSNPNNTPGTTYSWTVATTHVTGASAGGGNSVSQILTQTTSIDRQVTYTVVPSAAGCVGQSIDFVVTVKPEPKLSSTLVPSSCSATSVSYTPTSAVVGTTYAWSRAVAANISQAAASGTGSVTETLTNQINTSVSVPYAFTLTANGCTNTQTVTLSVKPAPTVGIAPPSQVKCSGETMDAVTFSNPNTVTGTTYSWTVAAANITGASAGTGSSLAQTLSQTTNVNQTATYSVVPIANGCSGVAATHVVTVKPIPVLQLSSSSQPICAGASMASVSFTNPNNVTGTTYSWSVSAPNITGATTGTGTSLSQVLNQTTSIDQTAVYTITPSANSCPGTPLPHTVTVRPKPVLSSTLAPSPVCSGAPIGYVPTSAVAGTTYAWTRSSVSNISEVASSNTGSINEALTNTTNISVAVPYSYTLTANTCTNTQTVTASIKPKPTINLSSATQSKCSGQVMDAVSFTNPNNVTGTTYSWTVVAPNVSGSSAGSGNSVSQTLSQGTNVNQVATYTVVPSANACSGVGATHVVTVRPIPTAQVTPATQTICAGESMASVAITNPNAVTGTTYAWTVSAPNVSGASSGTGTPILQSINQTTSTNQTATYTVVPTANSCPGVGVNHVVTIRPRPILSSTLTPSPVCSGTPIGYVPTSAVSGTTYAWSRSPVTNISELASNSTGSINESLTNTTNVSVSVPYTYTLTASGCTNTQTVTASIKPKPVINLSSSTQAKCSGQAMDVVTFTNPNNVAGTTYSWTVAAPNITGASAGSGTSVSQTLSQNTNINQLATYSVVGTANLCTSSSLTHVVTVKPIPTIQVSPTTQTICAGASMASVNISNPNSVSGTTFSWTVSAPNISGASAGSGSTLTQTLNQITSVDQTATYTIIPSASSCLGGTLTHTVTVKPKPVLSSTLSPSPICSGSPLSYAPTSAVSGTTYTWTRSAVTNISEVASSGTGSITEALTNTTNVSVSVPYSYTLSANSCTNTQTVTASIKPKPTVSLSSSSQSKCSGQVMDAVSITNPNAVSGTTFSWTVVATDIAGASAGTGTSFAQTLSHGSNLSLPATYTVTPSANSCSGTSITHVVTVKPIPTISVSPISQIRCSGETMTEVLFSNPNSVVGTKTYSWTVSAPNITGASGNSNGTSLLQTLSQSTLVNQTATYSVALAVNGCTSSPTTHVVTVKPKPTLSVVNNKTTMCSGETTNIQLTNPNGLTGTTFSWTVAAPNISGASAGSASSIAQALSQTTFVNQTATYSIIATTNGCNSASSNTAVTVHGLLAPGTIASAQTICAGMVPAALSNLTSPSGASGTYTYQWEQTTNGTTWSNATGASTLATYAPPALSTTTTYRRKATSCNLTVPTPQIAVTVNAQTIAGSVGPSIEAYGNASGSMSLSGHTGAVQKWQQKIGSGSWTDVSNTTTSLAYSSVTSTRYYRAEVKNGVCSSAFSSEGSVVIYPTPSISVSGSDKIAPGGSASIVCTPSNFTEYVWYYNNAILSGAPTTSYSLNATKPGEYKAYVKASNTATPIWTNEVVILDALTADIENLNYILTTTFNKAGVSESTDLFDLKNSEIAQNISYFDGLGRPMQSVAIGNSPTGKDLVQPITYDMFGREAVKYLPYEAQDRSGHFVAGALQEQADFYALGGNIASDPSPFSTAIFENSPLNRVVKQGAPGTDWQPDLDAYDVTDDHSVKYKYSVNENLEVLLWSVILNPTTLGSVEAQDQSSVIQYYAPGELTKNKTKDEQQHEVITFTDKSGKVLLKKVQSGDTEFAQTYYIYDEIGNLSCVIPPEAVKLILDVQSAYFNKSALEKETFLSRWAFRYKYDGRKRMIMKQVPGAQPVFMVYDDRDRLVLTQDGNQRLNDQWLFTKYDVLNRPVSTGIYSPGVDRTLDQMQSDVNLFYSTGGGIMFETFQPGTVTHDYTNVSFPNTPSANDYLTITYYDNYGFKSSWGAPYNYTDEGLSEIVGGVVYEQRDSHFNRVIGQVTGVKTKVLDGNATWLKTVNYYDDQNHVIQIISDNYRSSIDKVTTLYDFVGKVLETKTSHNGSDIKRRLVYDHAGRLLDTYHGVGSDEVLLSKNEYNSIGQVVTKKLHSRNGGANFEQNIDQRYNIRGWLENINDPSSPDASDLFSMKLNYNSPSVLGGDVQFNGNISEIIWSSAGYDKQSYGYEYDVMNRLSEAVYYNQVRPLENGRYNERIGDGTALRPGYDLNGNILNLLRNGKKVVGQGNIDNLRYDYIGNQLHVVNDATADNADDIGFKELTEKIFSATNVSTHEYVYDANGNMIKDDNKGITSILYNHLNLPQQVNKGATDYIVYTYDASGRKLRQQVFGTTPKTTDYAGEYIYENNTLRFINHEEGRIIPNGSSAPLPFEYQYHLKDHLGNVRLTFSEENTTTEYFATMEQQPASVSVSENNQFLNMNDIKKVPTQGLAGSYGYRLSGAPGEVVGPARSLNVEAGDIVDLEVYAKYLQPTSTGSAVSTFLSGLVGAFDLSAAGTGIDGQQALNTFNSLFSGGPWITPGNYEDVNAPKAFLNYLLFDENFALEDAGFDQVGTEGATAHELLAMHVKVKEKGYLYIYLSNENSTIVDVFFDELKVVHHTGVEGMDDYYPFGLTFNSYSRENSTRNRYLYNQGSGAKKFNTERVFDLQLNIDLTKYRAYEPVTGRWWQGDPKADEDELISQTPYNYSFNNPVRYNDPEGDCPSCFFGALVGAAVEYGSQVGANIYEKGFTKEAFTENIDVGDIAVAAVEGFLTSGASAVKNVALKTTIKVGAEIVRNAVDVDKNLNVKTNSVKSTVVNTAIGLAGNKAGDIVPTVKTKVVTAPSPKAAVKQARAQGPVTRTQRVAIEAKAAKKVETAKAIDANVKSIPGQTGTGAAAEELQRTSDSNLKKN